MATSAIQGEKTERRGGLTSLSAYRRQKALEKFVLRPRLKTFEMIDEAAVSDYFTRLLQHDPRDWQSGAKAEKPIARKQALPGIILCRVSRRKSGLA